MFVSNKCFLTTTYSFQKEILKFTPLQIVSRFIFRNPVTSPMNLSLGLNTNQQYREIPYINTPGELTAKRVNAERYISRLRYFTLIAPYVCVDLELVNLLDYIVIIACGTVNLQKPLSTMKISTLVKLSDCPFAHPFSVVTLKLHTQLYKRQSNTRLPQDCHFRIKCSMNRPITNNEFRTWLTFILREDVYGSIGCPFYEREKCAEQLLTILMYTYLHALSILTL